MPYKRGTMKQTALYNAVNRIRRKRNPTERWYMREASTLKYVGSSDMTKKTLREMGFVPFELQNKCNSSTQ